MRQTSVPLPVAVGVRRCRSRRPGGQPRWLALAIAASALLDSARGSLDPAVEQQWVFEFRPDQVHLQSVDGFHRASLDDGQAPCEAPGEPELPARGAMVLLPDGARVVEVAAQADEVLLREGLTLYPQQPSRQAGSPPSAGIVPPKPEAYAAAGMRPAACAELTGQYGMRGHPIACLRLYPLRYLPSERKLFLATRIRVTLRCQAAPRAADAIAPACDPGPFREMIRAAVVNPEAMAEAPAAASLAQGTRVDYLIITSTNLQPAFQRLADYRGAQYATAVACVEYIESAYPGVDRQDKIRNCIRDYVTKFGTAYVVLGGDDTVVPKRGCHVETWDSMGGLGPPQLAVERYMPTDLYYAGLDGTWDSNTNGTYGRFGEDEPDLLPDVFVGRIPVRRAAEANDYIDKVVRYETQTNAVPSNMLMFGNRYYKEYSLADMRQLAGEELTDGHAQLYDHAASDAEVYSRRMYRDAIQPYWEPGKLNLYFDTVTSWDGTNAAGHRALDSVGLSSNLNEGWHHVFGDTHGLAQKLTMEEKPHYMASDAAALTGRTDIVCVNACHTGGFDLPEDPCMSEAFLRNPVGGAVVYIGCSRQGWTDANDPPPTNSMWPGGASYVYSGKFYRELFQHRSRPMVEALAAAKASLVVSCAIDNEYRWIQFGLNFQGDPVLRDRPRHIPAPADVEATQGTDSNKVVITWSPVALEGTPTYEVWRSRTTVFASALPIATGLTSPHYEDYTPPPGLRYRYWVRCVQGGVFSDFSGGVRGYRTDNRPPPPEYVTATRGDFVDRVVLNWPVVSNAVYYHVEWTVAPAEEFHSERGDPDEFPNQRDQSDTPSNTYVIVSPHGEDHRDEELVFCRVSSADAVGTGAPSIVVVGWCSLLAAPTNVTATKGGHADKVRVTWDAVPGAGSYEVWRATVDGWTNAAWVQTLGGAPYDDTDTVPGQRYFYWVRATSGQRVGAAGGPDSGYRAGLPPPPAAVAATFGTATGRIVVSWSEVTEATAYDLWRSTVPDPASAGAITSPVPGHCCYTDLTAAADTPAYYWVSSRNVSGSSLFSPCATGVWWASSYEDATETAGKCTWSSTGTHAWVWEKIETHDGEDALRSTLAEGEYGISFVETVVAGPGLLSFWCRVEGDGELVLYLDGAATGVRVSATDGWVRRAIDIPAGLHTLRWALEYTGTRTGGGPVSAWLDEVDWTAGAGAAQPDLAILGLSMDPPNPNSGAPFTAYVTVTNSGNVDIAASYVDVWADRTNAAVVGEGGDGMQATGPLAIGATHTVAIGLTAPESDGMFTLRAFVDSQGYEAESNETNNQATLPYWVMHVGPTVCYVATNGASVVPYDTWARAATNIQDAVNQILFGVRGIVRVSNGTYRVPAPISVTQGAEIRSVNGAGVTVIEGTGSNRCVYLNHTNAVLNGFTVRNGETTGQGGGIYAEGGSLVANCRIVSNRAPDSSGGGMWICNATVSNCVFRDNRAYMHGGAVYGLSNALFRNCLFARNTVSNGWGGALYSSHGVVLENCTLADNAASDRGGGLYADTGGPVLGTNLILYGNRLDSGSSSNYYLADVVPGPGHALAFCCAGPLPTGPGMAGNLDAHPLFADPAAGDYRLQAGSPCRDRGTNGAWMAGAVDLAGAPRLANLTVDIGAYEYQPADAPDYRIARIVLLPASPGTGTLFSAQITVTNAGQSDGNAQWLDAWVHRPAPATAGATGDCYGYVGMIAAGGEQTVTIGNLPAPAIAGSYTFRAFANSAGHSNEIEQSNNQATLAYAVSSVEGDSDGDGLADSWELAYFANLTVADGTTDFDGDGAPDRDEQEAGTVPTNALSCLRIRAVQPLPGPGQVRIDWDSVTGRWYRLSSSSNLADWLYLGPELEGQSDAMSTTNAVTPPAYFRVRVRRP